MAIFALMAVFDKYWGVLRRLKPLYQVFNLSKAHLLKRQREAFKRFGIRKSVFASISSADFKHLPDLRPWSDQAGSLADSTQLNTLPTPIANALDQTWINGGYAILRGYFSGDFIDEVNAEVDQLINDQTIDFNYSGKKIMFAFRKGKCLKKIAHDPGITQALSFLAGTEMVPFQSINFEKSSEQRTHSDAIHMTTYPLGHLMAAWVALEDIGPDQGPLKYYPGSHKLPYVLNDGFNHGGSRWLLGKTAYLNYENHIEDLVHREQLKEEVLYAKKGDVFLWHGNLLHGALKMRQPELTRKSMVVHYLSPEVICYHEITQRPALIELENT